MSKPVAVMVMLLAAVCASPVAAQTPTGTSVGVLTCKMAPSIGLI
jgi:hypothetical protein